MSFAKDFLWGAASAAAQVEGGWLEDGRTPSIWDELYIGHTAHNDSPHTACDTYHRFREDVALMREMGLRSYRFSVSWSRVIPAPGTVNEKGLRYYSELTDALLDAGIVPMVTLYHWDMPMWLYRIGGWENPQSAAYFEEYARVMAKALSGRVKWWMTFNEPSVFVGQGHIVGQHAPFRKDDTVTVCNITRNILLAHGRAVSALRETADQPLKIGMALTGLMYTPDDASPEAYEKARRDSYEGNPSPRGVIWWSDTVFLGKAPAPLDQYLTAEDYKIICQKLDFFGNNIYRSKNHSEVGGANPRVYPGLPRTALKWPITPEVLYWQMKMQYERYGLPILITENGMANSDVVSMDGKVHDPQRTDFLRRYLAFLKQAADEGIPLLGYQYWSILDNYEWAEGYDARFGLIFVEYRTQKRILKDSAYEYAQIIRANGENLPDTETARNG